MLIGEFTPSAVLFSGTAGAVDPSLRQGDVVIGDRVAQYDVGLQTTEGIRRRGMRNAVTGALDPLVVPAPDTLLATARQSARDLAWPTMAMPDGDSRRPRVVEGVIVTGDVFMADVSRRAELRAAFDAAAIEMEGAAFVQTCRQFAVPCLVIRSVTDRADGQALASYERFLAVASENAAHLVAAIIAKLNGGPR